MAQFTVYTADTVPEAAKPSLEAAKASFGFIPNLQGTMAESPELLAGYSTLWALFAKTTLTPHEQQVVYMTSNFENECPGGHRRSAQRHRNSRPQARSAAPLHGSGRSQSRLGFRRGYGCVASRPRS